MDRDTFIMTVYCVVETHSQPLTALRPIRHSGVAPPLSDVEVLTMILCGAFFQRARHRPLRVFPGTLPAFFPRPHGSSPLRAASGHPLAAPRRAPAAPRLGAPPCCRPRPRD